MELPNTAEIARAAERLGFALDAAALDGLARGVRDLVGAVRVLDGHGDQLPRTAVARTPGYRPDRTEDPLHAWYRKTEIAGARGGPLAGRSFAVKDNICVAGVAMMNGASSFEGYVPEVDATVVARLLEAGAVLKGKAHCEYLCFSGDSHTNATGPTENPRRPGYSAGGSSSGSAALVAAGDVDFALGCDQGGSIRMPAHFCGVYGLKPTWGLVPYTGIIGVDATIDHVGPLSTTVEASAAVLEVIAGEDGLDPRQRHAVLPPYRQALAAASLSGVRVGVLVEGFGHPGGDAEVDKTVRAALEAMRLGGASVEEVSVPMHRLGGAIWSAIVLEGGLETMMLGNAMGTGWKGLYLDSLARYQSLWRTNPGELPAHIRVAMLAGELLHREYNGRYYHKAQNLSRQLAAAYDAALGSFHVLAMPTVPFVARPHPSSDDAAGEAHLETSQTVNCAPFDCTGHPAMSLPCGLVDGLPVGLMLVAAQFGEPTLFRIAGAFEAQTPWTER